MLLFVATNFLSAQNILVVDRDGSFSNPDIFSDDWQYFQPVFDQLGYDYDYYEVEDLSLNGPDWLTMTEYSMVFWFTGETWDGATTMTDLDEENLATYLEAFNGKLLLSSQDYLWDRYQTYGTFTSEMFPYKYLGVTEVAQDIWNIDTPDTATVVGGLESYAEGLAFAIQDIYTEEADDGLFIDQILQHQGEDLLIIETPEPTGVAALQFDPGTHKVIFSTASLAGITSLFDRTEFIFRSIGWLHGTTGFNDIKLEQTELLIHPNPASAFVQIGCEETMEEIWIMNNSGQVVDYFNIGTNDIKINTSTYSAGMYFTKVKTINGNTFSKFIVE
jgi:hypothetical protein